MRANPAGEGARRRFVLLSTTAAVSTYLLIVLGGIVRATGSGMGCPDWPLCQDGAFPVLTAPALIEFAHRVAAALTSPLILLTAWAAWRGRRRESRLAWVGVGLLVVQILLGALSVRLRLPPEIVAAHLGNALAILGIQTWIAAAAWQTDDARPRLARSFGSPGLAEAISAVLLFMVLASGAWVASRGAEFACTGWPLCGGVIWPAHDLGRIHMLHRLAVLAVSISLGVLVSRSWRGRFERPAAAVASAVTASLFVAQAAVGAVGVVRGFPPELVGLHVATASAVWACLVLTIALRTRPAVASAAAPLPQARPRALDYLALTKPLIVALLLVTTLTGMIVGLGAWPAWGLVAITFLAGAASAGGASAINQFIDRDRDQHMSRTRNRPLPRGAMGPAEALSFGLVLCVVGFYLFALGANLLSALLALAGMTYYILLYSLALKPSTTRNIVIGGGAGAIPPMVGWAAATGRIEMGAFFLFALVFFWTPPHFWALALVRQNDYEKAGVPMLPVVYGERETRRQILLYAIQLVALSLFLPVAQLGGGISTLAAAVLGGGFLFYAWKLWREGGRKVAWGLYRYSSLYLALLFGALVVDTLVRG
ncbi:MAG: heme o synthase [Anaerolineales bacterium]